MTQEDKELLLKDLCARLPYGVCIETTAPDVYKWLVFQYEDLEWWICDLDENIVHLPYLRPMSSMTEEEEIYYNTIYTTLKFYEKEDWLKAHHFDYRGLIPMGLALEATEGMYKTE